MNDCIFCAIVAGKIPADTVHTTANTVAFRDIEPEAPTHVLVVPRVHIESAATLGADHGELLAEMMSAAQAVAASEAIAESGYRLVFNVGPDALNSVGHLHLHVLGGRRMGRSTG